MGFVLILLAELGNSALADDPLGEFREAPPADIGAAFALADLSGTKTDQTAHRGGLVFVHFFATWCEPCREELPALQRLAERSKGPRLTVLAISVGEVEPRVRRFFKDTPVHYPVLLDIDRTVAKAWQVHTLPTTYVLDASLTPRLVVEHDLDWDKIDLVRLRGRLSADDHSSMQSGQVEESQ